MPNHLIPKIYIVDDDEAVRFAIAMLVESCGWNAQPCASAEEFLQVLTANGLPACLVLDLNMPGMDGAELLELLSSEGRSLPVIVVTGFDESPLTARARRAGVHAVLVKPFQDQLLLDHVRAALHLNLS